MIDLEEYLNGGFCWSFKGKPVSRFYSKEKEDERAESPSVELKCMVTSDIAQALCLAATERCMRVGELLSREIEYQVRRWLGA